MAIRTGGALISASARRPRAATHLQKSSSWPRSTSGDSRQMVWRCVCDRVASLQFPAPRPLGKVKQSWWALASRYEKRLGLPKRHCQYPRPQRAPAQTRMCRKYRCPKQQKSNGPNQPRVCEASNNQHGSTLIEVPDHPGSVAPALVRFRRLHSHRWLTSLGLPHELRTDSDIRQFRHQLLVAVTNSRLRVVTRAFTLSLGGCNQCRSCLIIAFVMFSNRSHVVIGSGDMAGCCEMVVFA